MQVLHKLLIANPGKNIPKRLFPNHAGLLFLFVLFNLHLGGKTKKSVATIFSLVARACPPHIVLEARFGVISKTFSGILFMPWCTLDTPLSHYIPSLPRLQRPPPTFKHLSLL